MSVREQNEAIVRRFIDTMNRGDWANQFVDAREDFRLTIMFPDDPHHFTLAEIADFERNTVAPAFEKEVLNLDLHQLMHADDSYVLAWVTGRGRFKTGVDYRNTYVHVWKFEGGKAVSLIEYTEKDAAILFRREVEAYWKGQGREIPRPEWMDKATAA